MRRQKSFPIGEFSAGTLLASDLLSAHADALRAVGARRLANKLDAFNAKHETDDVDHGDASEEAGWLLDDADQELNSRAPAYVSWGSSEGDGASFGFWPSIDQLTEDVRHGAGRPDAEAFRLEDYAAAPWGAIVADVNDHGNVSVYVKTRGFPSGLRLLWDYV